MRPVKTPVKTVHTDSAITVQRSSSGTFSDKSSIRGGLNSLKVMSEVRSVPQRQREEVQEVKATLQDMLAQLKKSTFDEEEEEQEDKEQFHDVEDGETLEVEEDNYFSDSWEI
ncbi:hypothetical protein SRHO_G00039040 [Serrasalmus rhombeus]